MEDITRLSEQLHELDVRHVVPTPARNAFPCSVIGGNSIGPNRTTPTIAHEDKIKILTKSSRDTNPFYNPKLNLEAGAMYLHKILRAALGAREAWLKEPVDRVHAMAERSSDHNPFIRMCRDFNHILFFLEHGRRGFDLTFLPDNFFADVEALLPGLLMKVEKLSEIEDCAFLHETGVVALRGMKLKLGEIKDLRNRIWLQTKETYERQQDADGVASLPGIGGRVILPVRKKGKIASSQMKAQGESRNETKHDLKVDMAFTAKQESEAAKGMESMEYADSTRDQGVALDQNGEIKAGEERSGNEQRHEDGRDISKPDSVPSANRTMGPECALFVEEELEVDTGCDEKVADEVPSDDEAINPEFALFVEDEEEGDARDDNTANVAVNEANKTEQGLRALEADCELDASGGT
jgi:hypothetical protein